MEENKKDVLILAIETSCDETAAAVVKNGREVLSNTIYTQIKLHTLFGGVVPEIASRKHIEKINIVIETALKEAGVSLEDIDAIAVTYGPGLVGALLVGVAEAKAIAYATKKPLVGVHHIEGHISANYIEHKELEPPFLCMVASGGHSHLVLVKDYGEYEIIGRTRDDAAGEAFDKVARAIGLGYPGGPKIDKLAKEGDKKAIAFPRAKITDAPDDFSFSGLKSAELFKPVPDERRGSESCRCGSFFPAVGNRCSYRTYSGSGKAPWNQKSCNCRRGSVKLFSSCADGRSLPQKRTRILPSVTNLLYR